MDEHSYPLQVLWFEKVHLHVETDGRHDVLTGKTPAVRFNGTAKRFRKKPKVSWTEQPREKSSSKYIFCRERSDGKEEGRGAKRLIHGEQ